MVRAEAAITIKQNKKKTEIGRHPYNEKGDRACLIMAQRQRLMNILSVYVI